MRCDELSYRIRKLNGFIDGDQVAAALDDFEPCVWDPSHDLALVLLNGVELVEFTGED